MPMQTTSGSGLFFGHPAGRPSVHNTSNLLGYCYLFSVLFLAYPWLTPISCNMISLHY